MWMRFRCAVAGEGGSGSVGVAGDMESKARGASASGDVCSFRDRDAKRGGPGRGDGADRCVLDSRAGLLGDMGVAGVTEMARESLAAAPDSGRQGRGRIDGLRESWR